MSEPRIPIPKDQLAEFCKRNHITRLALFGSVLRDDFGPESDVDVLVRFEPDHKIGFEIVAICDELSELLGGRPVDLVEEQYLSHRLRDRILASAEDQYAA